MIEFLLLQLQKSHFSLYLWLAIIRRICLNLFTFYFRVLCTTIKSFRHTSRFCRRIFSQVIHLTSFKGGGRVDSGCTRSVCPSGPACCKLKVERGKSALRNSSSILGRCCYLLSPWTSCISATSPSSPPLLPGFLSANFSACDFILRMCLWNATYTCDWSNPLLAKDPGLKLHVLVQAHQIN